MQALSQLSYSPTREARNVGKRSRAVKEQAARGVRLRRTLGVPAHPAARARPCTGREGLICRPQENGSADHSGARRVRLGQVRRDLGLGGPYSGGREARVDAVIAFWTLRRALSARLVTCLVPATRTELTHIHGLTVQC